MKMIVYIIIVVLIFGYVGGVALVLWNKGVQG